MVVKDTFGQCTVQQAWCLVVTTTMTCYGSYRLAPYWRWEWNLEVGTP